ncbi:MAG: spermidine synthase [Candidatus Brocadiia bacterium]
MPEESARGGHPRLRLAGVSFAILYLELACIRWFPSYVHFLAYFSNFVLLACFLGMSSGCLAARSRRHWVSALPLVLLGSMVLALGIYALYYLHLTWLSLGEAATAQQRLYFGGSTTPLDFQRVRIPMEAVVAVFFALIALVFVGPGQELGRALDAVPSRVQAYAVNLGASLAGIAAFALSSLACLPPLAWFAVGLAPLAPFLHRGRRLRWVNAAAVAALLVLLGVTSEGVIERAVIGPDYHVYWSPYYKVHYRKGGIHVNDLGHQVISSRHGEEGLMYALPYLLRRDSGGSPAQRVLVVGAGCGNDVSRALGRTEAVIDAVEIDPVIVQLGRRRHPDDPYDDPRVEVHTTDARGFLRRTRRQYDVIVYGCVDSLTLLSAYSSIRLENYLFTEEAFREVRRHLRPGGQFFLYNTLRRHWLSIRIYRALEAAFGRPPLVITWPHEEELELDEPARVVFFAAGAIEGMREGFERAGAYRVPLDGGTGPRRNGFADREAEEAEEIRLTRVSPEAPIGTATDDWPFLYLRRPVLPRHAWVGLSIALAISVALLVALVPGHRLRLSPHFFFLGAGFMLVETRSITRLSLLFGSTWLVNSVTFFAILVMALLANAYVALVRPRRHRVYYVLLFGALAVAYAVPLDALLSLGMPLRLATSALLTFVPIFFAGVIFATSFAASREPDAAFGANVAGAMLGGALEYLSLVVGFQALLLIAIAIYGVSWAGLGRARAAAA